MSDQTKWLQSCSACGWEGTDPEVNYAVAPDEREYDTCPECGGRVEPVDLDGGPKDGAE